MRKLIAKPYLLFWMTVPVLILSGFTGCTTVHSIDFNGNDVALSQMNISILLAIVFEIVGIGYWIMNKQNRKASVLLNALHVLSSLVGIILLCFYTFLMSTNIKNFTIIYSISITLILGAQLFFPINLWLAFFKKSKSVANL